ncbi:MAG: OmpP1/FadL family transporter [bacterium]
MIKKIVLIVMISAVPCSSAYANVFDLFGVDSVGIAMGNARVASADDWSGMYYNPAAITQTKESVGVNFIVAVNHLYTKPFGTGFQNTDDKAIEGIAVGYTHDFLADFVRIGIALYTPLSDTQQQIAHYSNETEAFLSNKLYFEMLENTTEQQIILPTIAFKILPFLSIGGGVSLFVKSLTYSNVYLPNPMNESEWYMNVNNTQKYTYVANLGMLFNPSERFKIGISYMSADDFPIVGAAFVHLNTNMIPPGLIASNVTQTINQILFYSPAHASLGIMYKPMANFELDAEITWVGWSGYKDNHGMKPQDQSWTDPRTGVTYQGQSFDDIYIPRIGVNYKLDSSWHIMAGYYYEPTPVPPQMRRTNYVDNVKNVVSTGVSYIHSYKNGGSIRYTIHIQDIILGDRKTYKEIAVDADPVANGIQNPGYPGYESKGYIIDTGFEVGYEFL